VVNEDGWVVVLGTQVGEWKVSERASLFVVIHCAILLQGLNSLLYVQSQLLSASGSTITGMEGSTVEVGTPTSPVSYVNGTISAAGELSITSTAIGFYGANIQAIYAFIVATQTLMTSNSAITCSAALTITLTLSTSSLNVINSTVAASSISIQTAQLALDESSTITASALGPTAPSTQGAGGTINGTWLGGGGHGGSGGGVASTPPIAGPPFDSVLTPGLPGGPGYSSTSYTPGGGYILINSTNSVTVGGTISADGGDGSTVVGGGGGAGGTVLIQTSQILGQGTISANGGAGRAPAGEGMC
jgi:hypothetical protein